MGRDTTMIALDSNAMTHWIDAMGSVSGPPADPEGDEKMALARIFLWMPTESCFHYTPTVETEYQAITDRAKREDHLSWALTLISAVRPLPNPVAVEARAAVLKQEHSGEEDCRIVAECELTEIVTLLTCDRKLLRNLAANRGTMTLCLPSVYWKAMAVPRGTPPMRAPHVTNPMSHATWWNW